MYFGAVEDGGNTRPVVPNQTALELGRCAACELLRPHPDVRVRKTGRVKKNIVERARHPQRGKKTSRCPEGRGPQGPVTSLTIISQALPSFERGNDRPLPERSWRRLRPRHVPRDKCGSIWISTIYDPPCPLLQRLAGVVFRTRGEVPWLLVTTLLRGP